MVESLKNSVVSELELEDEIGGSEFTDKVELLDKKFKEVEKLSNTPIVENLKQF
jgi:hypothetical protein